MSDADPDPQARLVAVAKRRFKYSAEEKAILEEHKVALSRIDATRDRKLKALRQRADEADTEIVNLIEENRPDWIDPKMQSFAISCAKFQLRKYESSVTVADPTGVMKLARELNVVRQVGKPPTGKWHLIQEMFFAWLEDHPEFREEFGEFLKEKPAGEAIYMSPNTGYTLYFNKKWIKPPKIIIKS